MLHILTSQGRFSNKGKVSYVFAKVRVFNSSVGAAAVFARCNDGTDAVLSFFSKSQHGAAAAGSVMNYA